MQQERDASADLCEEIAGLARTFLNDPYRDGIQEIDKIILTALNESRWDDVSKWHRVRLRYLRFKQERRVAARMLSPSASPA